MKQVSVDDEENEDYLSNDDYDKALCLNHDDDYLHFEYDGTIYGQNIL